MRAAALLNGPFCNRSKLDRIELPHVGDIGSAVVPLRAKALDLAEKRSDLRVTILPSLRLAFIQRVPNSRCWPTETLTRTLAGV